MPPKYVGPTGLGVIWDSTKDEIENSNVDLRLRLSNKNLSTTNRTYLTISTKLNDKLKKEIENGTLKVVLYRYRKRKKNGFGGGTYVVPKDRIGYGAASNFTEGDRALPSNPLANTSKTFPVEKVLTSTNIDETKGIITYTVNISSLAIVMCYFTNGEYITSTNLYGGKAGGGREANIVPDGTVATSVTLRPRILGLKKSNSWSLSSGQVKRSTCLKFRFRLEGVGIKSEFSEVLSIIYRTGELSKNTVKYGFSIQ